MSYIKEVQKELNWIEGKRKKVIAQVPHVKKAIQFKKAFETKEREISISIGYDVSSLNGTIISVRCKENVLKMIKPMLSWLAQAGYKQTKKPNDYAEIQRRTWYCGDINLSVFMEGEVCKFVEIGKREEPVYELQCN